jgi:hypothetical protein
VRQVVGIERLPLSATEDQRPMRALGEPLRTPPESASVGYPLAW